MKYFITLFLAFVAAAPTSIPSEYDDNNQVVDYGADEYSTGESPSDTPYEEYSQGREAAGEDIPEGASASVIPNFSGTMDSDLKADGGAGMHGNFGPKSELVARADMRARAGMNADMKTNLGSRLGDLGAKLSAGMTTGMKAKAGMRNGMKADMRAGVDLTGGFGAGF
ncbi:hypothetical protein DSO57_1001023 [Entomophthora muscae]|uniref:Uncharacterized protein n=1 Tax=Entomophthora muscae TaxID=34485 RepID=A0ACC2UV15_9FUNG|nr:hypothetical protein DSO57_1001023 [Entomophthora muscae]